MKIYPDRKVSTTVKFSKLLFIDMLPVKKENFYLDLAAAVIRQIIRY